MHVSKNKIPERGKHYGTDFPLLYLRNKTEQKKIKQTSQIPFSGKNNKKKDFGKIKILPQFLIFLLLCFDFFF